MFHTSQRCVENFTPSGTCLVCLVAPCHASMGFSTGNQIPEVPRLQGSTQGLRKTQLSNKPVASQLGSIGFPSQPILQYAGKQPCQTSCQWQILGYRETCWPNWRGNSPIFSSLPRNPSVIFQGSRSKSVSVFNRPANTATGAHSTRLVAKLEMTCKQKNSSAGLKIFDLHLH